MTYGAGLARYLAANGVEVVEVNRPNRQARRRRGKSDPADAEAAARAALNGEASARYKGDGRVAGLRCLRVTRRSAVKARTQAANQISDMLLTAPQELRDRLRSLTTKQVVDVAVRFRPRVSADPAELTKTALRSLARRDRALGEEIDQLDTQMAELVTHITPPKMLERMARWGQRCRQLAHRCGRQPWMPLQGEFVRGAVRIESCRCLVRKAETAPTQPKRRPSSTRSIVVDRVHPHDAGPVLTSP
jgi:hypothetical protein